MRKIIILTVAAFLIAIFGWILLAQEQKPGQPLLFEKGKFKEHPSDLHMGSDPYYEKEKHKIEGTDETGYPREYDPNVEYTEETTTYKVIDKKKKD